jgi:D-alanyl-D-alanine carboxypeptidase
MLSRRSAFCTTLIFAACTAVALSTSRASAEALLVIEVESGKVLHAENATYPWYPASVTKLMTAYVTLRAVKDGRMTLDKLLPVSHVAASQNPTKMGFKVGTQVTADNALKMLMVKSANDVAVVLAEGVSGSVENFADEMNRAARRLGMTQSNFVNPNGLPADDQVSSARDLAILARALIREFPEYDSYWHIPAIRFGNKVIRNYNTLIGRYPGADGMKTGFICASGFNLVASATRDGKRLITVVLGAPSSPVRAIKTAQLLERGFNTGPLAWLTPSLGTVDALVPIDAAPPNLREQMCGKNRKRPASEEEEDTVAGQVSSDSPYAVFLSSLRAPNGKSAALLQEVRMGPPVVVFTGSRAPSAIELAATEAKTTKSGKSAKTKGKSGTATAKTAPWSTLSPSSAAENPPTELASPADAGKSKAAKSKQKADPKDSKAAKKADPKAGKKADPKDSQKTAPKTSQKTSPQKTSQKASDTVSEKK